MLLITVFAIFITYIKGDGPKDIPLDLDNRNYVEGESRFMWMYDADGVPHHVDLQQDVDPRGLFDEYDGSNNEYWLYTRSNPGDYQKLVIGDSDSISKSNYDPNLPVKAIVHGYLNTGNCMINRLIKKKFLEVENCNVIVVDWHQLSHTLYTTAVRGVPSVGEYLGHFLEWTFDVAGGDWNKTHLVGHSLGAHVVGAAGRTTGSLPARITGMDPAGPLWISNPNSLRSSDAQYVEAIHTDGGVFGFLGILATVDFYVNGGKQQPQCLSIISNICSHSRSFEIFAASLEPKYKFMGKKCKNLEEALNIKCSGELMQMGDNALIKQGSGIYEVVTTGFWPYVVNAEQ